ncbi:MAG: hypothetical protein RLZZ399_1260 [Verrucomicrobiota bacterium]|jgi:iron-sulfur cluster assembly protein
MGEGDSRSLEAAGDQSQRGLRVFVEKGGCAGLQYGMKVDSVREGDLVSEKDGARVMVDPESAGYLQGAHLDYCDDLTGTGFRIENPNAVRSCGCGTSFEPSDSGSGISEAAEAGHTAVVGGAGAL